MLVSFGTPISCGFSFQCLFVQSLCLLVDVLCFLNELQFHSQFISICSDPRWICKSGTQITHRIHVCHIWIHIYHQNKTQMLASIFTIHGSVMDNDLVISIENQCQPIIPVIYKYKYTSDSPYMIQISVYRFVDL